VDVNEYRIEFKNLTGEEITFWITPTSKVNNYQQAKIYPYNNDDKNIKIRTTKKDVKLTSGEIKVFYRKKKDS
jgi:hypothetical protein